MGWVFWRYTERGPAARGELWCYGRGGKAEGGAAHIVSARPSSGGGGGMRTGHGGGSSGDGSSCGNGAGPCHGRLCRRRAA